MSLPMFRTRLDGMSSNRKFVEMGGILWDIPASGRIYIWKNASYPRYEFWADGDLVGFVDTWEEMITRVKEMRDNVEDPARAECLSNLLSRMEQG
jgi:hypothetical protein